MDQHLRDGCTECVDAYNAWYGLAVFAEEDRALEAPADAVRLAKSYLAQRTFQEGGTNGRQRTSLPSMLATLVFDSLQAMPAGVRAGTAYSRHLLFAAESLAIDLHIETASKAGWFLLAGQIADSSRPDQPQRHELALVDHATEISTFRTNEFGEFHCTFDRRKDLTLLLSLENGAIALPLDALFTNAPSLTSSKES